MQLTRKKGNVFLALGALCVMLFVWCASRGRKTYPNVWTPMEQSEYAALVPFWQAVTDMESARGTSQLAKQYNNIAGMKQPVKRDTSSLGGTPSGFSKSIWATYAGVDDCVQDLVFWCREFNCPYNFQTLNHFVAWLGSKSYFVGESVETYYNKVYATLKQK